MNLGINRKGVGVVTSHEWKAWDKGTLWRLGLGCERERVDTAPCTWAILRGGGALVLAL